MCRAGHAMAGQQVEPFRRRVVPAGHNLAHNLAASPEAASVGARRGEDRMGAWSLKRERFHRWLHSPACGALLLLFGCGLAAVIVEPGAPGRLLPLGSSLSTRSQGQNQQRIPRILHQGKLAARCSTTQQQWWRAAAAAAAVLHHGLAVPEGRT